MEDDIRPSLRCANHPQVETLLRCNRCGKPICTNCAVHTPVGYRCKECIRGQQEVFYTATRTHQLLGTLVACILGLLLGLVAFFAAQLSWLAIFVGPVAGGLVGEATFRASARKRARNFEYIGSGLAAAAALLVFTPLVLLLRFGNIWTLLWGLIFIVLAIGTVYARLR